MLGVIDNPHVVRRSVGVKKKYKKKGRYVLKAENVNFSKMHSKKNLARGFWENGHYISITSIFYRGIWELHNFGKLSLVHLVFKYIKNGLSQNVLKVFHRNVVLFKFRCFASIYLKLPQKNPKNSWNCQNFLFGGRIWAV